MIARNSTFVYRGRAVDVREVAHDLGVRYVLEGSVRAAGRRLRVTGQLIEAESAKHIWAERYDRELSDIFAVQDDITARVVAAVEPHLYVEESSRAALSIPTAPSAGRAGPRACGQGRRAEGVRPGDYGQEATAADGAVGRVPERRG